MQRSMPEIPWPRNPQINKPEIQDPSDSVTSTRNLSSKADGNLDDGKLGSSNVKSIYVRSEACETFLASIRCNESVDLDSVNVVKLLQSSLDLSLVCLDIDDENKSVVLLNLLHCRLCVERVNDDFVRIQAGLMWNRLAGILGRSRNLNGLRLVEGRGVPDFARLLRVAALENSFGCFICLLVASLAGTTCKPLYQQDALSSGTRNICCLLYNSISSQFVEIDVVDVLGRKEDW